MSSRLEKASKRLAFDCDPIQFDAMRCEQVNSGCFPSRAFCCNQFASCLQLLESRLKVESKFLSNRLRIGQKKSLSLRPLGAFKVKFKVRACDKLAEIGQLAARQLEASERRTIGQFV